MALKAPDMSSCTPKRKCLGGANDGTVYTVGDECQADQVFDPGTCDCSQVYDCNCLGSTLVMNYKALYKERNTSCVDQATQKVCQGFGGVDLSTTVTVSGLIADQPGEWIDNYDVSATTPGTCPGPNMRGALKLKRCVNGVAEDYIYVLSMPGCTVNGLERGIHEYIVGGSKTFSISNFTGPDCLSRFKRVYYTVQNHDTQPCAGHAADPCDSGGACPTTVSSTNSQISIYNSTTKIVINSFQEFRGYSDTNSFCPANQRPPGQTWADVFGTDNVSFGTTKGAANTIQTVGYTNSLWAICTDENCKTWAILVDIGWGGTVQSVYKGGGGYTNITYQSEIPIGGPAGICP